MTIPTKIKVGYLEYDVQLHQLLNNDAGVALYGQHSAFETWIKINLNANPAQMKASLVHELLHAVLDQYYPAHLANEERLVNALTTGLTNLFNDNPELGKYLCG